MPPVGRKPDLAVMLVAAVVLLIAATACDGAIPATSPHPAANGEVTATANGATPKAAGEVPSESLETSASAELPPAHDHDIQFEHLSIEEGLSQSVVQSIVQDHKGFLWFGTQDGLNLYDGYEFVIYRHDPEDPDSLGNSLVNVVYEDSSGVLWVGTNGGGLDRLDRATGRFIHYQHDPGDAQSLSSNLVLSIYEDRQQELWIGTDGGGLNRLDRANGRFEHYRHDPNNAHSLSSNSVVTLYEDRAGELWIGTDGGGLNRLDRSTGRFERFQHDPEDASSLSHDAVFAIHEDAEGALWLGTNGGGLNRLDRVTGRFEHYQNDPADPGSLSHDQVWAIYADEWGELWIGTFGGGLNRRDPETGRFVHYRNDATDPDSLGNNHVWEIYEDRAGTLWIGTFGNGVNWFDRHGKRFRHIQANPNDPESLSENVVWSILQDQQDVLWIGTNGGGLNRQDPTSNPVDETGTFVHYRHVPTDTQSLGDDVVWSLFEDREGILWVGTSSGLDRFDRNTQQFDHFPANPVFTIIQDGEGDLWIGTWGGGLGRFDPETEQFVFYLNDPTDPDSLNDDSVVSILEDAEGRLWVGTFNGGLNQFDRAANRFIHYQADPENPQSLSNNTVMALYESRDGEFWVATAGGGLNRFDRERATFHSYREKDGLSSDFVYGILEDDLPPEQGGPHLWLSTNRGISKFSPRTEAFKTYDAGDGLQSSEFNQGAYHQSRSGEIYFGGVNGFNSFYPEQVKDNAYLPPIVLTALSQAGEDPLVGTVADSLAEVSLKWPRNSFEFEFAALSYVRSEKNQYAYRLEGFDSEWIETGTRRFGRYTNLPGGTYTLRLKGSNNDGLWNEHGTSLRVNIVPPFWRTWGFQGLVAVALLGAVVGGYVLRVRSVETRSRELEVQVADRTRELGALNAVAAVVSRSLDLQKILDDALDVTLRLTGTQGGGVYLLDEKGQAMILATHRGFGAAAVSEIDRLQVGEGFSGQVVQSGQPLVVEDISADVRLSRMLAQGERFHSMVCVPLNARGSVAGTLFATSQDRRVFTEKEVQLLTSISQQIGVALQNAQLYRAEQRRAEQFRLISEVGRHIITILELEPLLHEIVRRVSEILGYYLVDIGLIEGDEVVIESGVGPCWEHPDYEPIRLAVGGESIVGWVAAAGEPLLAPDVSLEPRYYAVAEIPDTQSELAVPMRTKHRVIGVLDVQSRHIDAFDESDVVVLQALADQAAVAIEKAQLLEAERKRADELEALRTTMAELTAELKLSALLQAIVERAAGLLDATGGELGLYDEARQEIEIVVSYNLGHDYVGTRHRLGEGAMGRVAQTEESVILDDYQAWEGGLSEYGHVRATLAAPLMVGSRLVGVFTSVTTDPDRRFSSADLHLLNLFARQAAIAIENARLYGQAQQLAIVQERQRLARDLHDSVSQALYGIRLYSEAAAEELSLGRQDLVVEYLGELQETAQDALAEMRLLIHELRPTVLAEEGLVAALQARLQSVEERAGLKTELRVQVEDQLPAELEEELYRIAQEALNNALRHAQASQVGVRLEHSRQANSVILEVIDNGMGFDPEAVQDKGGIGLSAMKERTLGLGGKLTVTSEPQRGTCVRVEVPL